MEEVREKSREKGGERMIKVRLEKRKRQRKERSGREKRTDVLGLKVFSYLYLLFLSSSYNQVPILGSS